MAVNTVPMPKTGRGNKTAVLHMRTSCN